MSFVGVWYFHPDRHAVQGYRHGHMDLELGDELHAFVPDTAVAPVKSDVRQVRCIYHGALKTFRKGRRALDIQRELDARHEAGFPVPDVLVTRLYRPANPHRLGALKAEMRSWSTGRPRFNAVSVDGTYNCSTFVMEMLRRSGYVEAWPCPRSSHMFFMPEVVFKALTTLRRGEHPLFSTQRLRIERGVWSELRAAPHGS